MLIKKYFFFLTLFFVACNSFNELKEENTNESNLVPITASLNTKNGYNVNIVSGDSIITLLNSTGDTILTGKSYAILGNKIDPDSLENVKVKKMITPKIIETNKNIVNSVYELPKTPIVLSELPQVTLGQGDSLFELLSKKGNVLLSGVQQNFDAVVELVSNTPQVNVKSLVYKDNAISNFQYMDVDQGLPSSYVSSIIEDRNGNIWFGTKGGGVAMFNGESFKNIGVKEGLGSDYVNLLLEDSNGNIWICTNKVGISVYDGKKLNHYSEKNGLSSDDIKSIYEDSKGNVWLGATKGVTKFTPNQKGSVESGTFINYTTKEGLSNNLVLSIIEDKQGNIWFGTSNGLNKFDGDSFTYFNKNTGLCSNFIIALLEDQNGAIWIGTNNGFNIYEDDSLSYFSEENGLIDNVILSIFQNKAGDYWFATKGGISKFNSTKNGGKSNLYFTNFTEKEGLSNAYCHVIIEDKSNNLWIGTRGGGACVYKENSFKHFTINEGLLNHEILSISDDHNGNMWFGSRSNGVSKYDGKSFQHYLFGDEYPMISVRSILEDSKGKLWFGTYRKGLFVYDEKNNSFINYSKKTGLSGNAVYTILEDSNGNIWIGTNDGGITVFNNDSKIHFTEKEGLSSNKIYTIKEGEKGTFWIGSSAGLSKLVLNKTEDNYNVDNTQSLSGKIINYTEKEGVSNTFVRSILVDYEGIVWLGTDGGGVNRFDGEKFTYYTEREGLSNNTIWSIQEDANKAIWLTTEFGVNKLIDTDKDYKRIIKYGKQDGLKGVDFLNNSAYINGRDVMWLGSGKSLTMLNLNSFKTSNTAPTIQLNDVNINTQFIDFNNNKGDLITKIEFSNVQSFSNYPINLKLPYNLNHLTFHFAATDWTAPHKIRYSYILEGLNTEWSAKSEETKADYRNLPYGTYKFKVKAIGESNLWSTPFVYEFKIYPPWWHTWWAKILYALISLIILYGLIRWRTKQLQERQLVLESEIKDATQEIRAQKEKVESAHRITEQQKIEVEEQKEIIEETHREIKDSINYAKRLQDAILPSKDVIDTYLPENFIYFKPKDIVSGDFYWFKAITEENDNTKLTTYIAAADCTGHGVPGALVSIVCSNSLDRSVKEFGLREPSEILDKTRELVIETFAKSGENVKDGMDIALCAISDNTVTFAGANNPLWIIRKLNLLTEEEKLNKSTMIIDDLALIEIKGDKQPIGLYEGMKPFSQHSVKLHKHDFLYFFTDGYADQFGGDKGKKLKYKPFKKLLIELNAKSTSDINSTLNQFFEEWKGSLEQIDDVCIVGIRF